MTANIELPHVLLSGPLSVGKTTLAWLLVREHAYRVVSARESLRAIASRPLGSRKALQDFGTKLEEETGGRWMADVLRRELQVANEHLVVDALRTLRQASAAREALAPRVAHIHLIARPEDLDLRFETRDEPDIEEAASMAAAARRGIERSTRDLLRVADLVIETSGLSPDEVLSTAEQALLQRC